MKAFWLFISLLSFNIQAQEAPFPQKGPLEMTVLFPAGSSADVTARLLADGMSQHLGQRVLVVNRPGAGGAIGYKHVASQKADGYSLVWNSNSISTTYHSGQLASDYKAFDAVARVLSESVVVAVRSDSQLRTLGELVTEARRKPRSLSIGHSGIGSHTHISLAAFSSAAGIQVTEVPFGAAQVVPSLLGGHVDAVVQFPGALAAPLGQKQVRLLATLTQARDPALPGVPTAREQGFDAALDAWRGIAVPRGTPRETIEKLENAIRRTAESPEFAAQAARLGVRPAFLPAGEFSELISQEDASLSRLLQMIGLKKSPQ